MKTVVFICILILQFPLGGAGLTKLAVEPSINLDTHHQSSNVGELMRAAENRLQTTVVYDGSYHAIKYPNGDVPANIGVCTDVIIRIYRELGIDLQQLVHIDMQRNFALYPTIWGLKRPDPNIDHRRVPNLQVFFSRFGKRLEISSKATDYKAGDIVTWMLPGNLPHIGIVVTDRTADEERPLIVHNVGSGPEKSDFLFSFPITGHYRFYTEALN